MSTYTVDITVTVTADDQTLAYLLAESAIYEGIGKVPGARVERIAEPHEDGIKHVHHLMEELERIAEEQVAYLKGRLLDAEDVVTVARLIAEHRAELRAIGRLRIYLENAGFKG